MSQWSCKTSKLDERGQPAGDLDALTVGQKFLLSCEGDRAPLQAQSARLELPEAQKYALRLLSASELGDTRGQLIVTTWTPGEVKLESVVLTDGATRVELGPLEFIVKSVIPEDNQQPQPFGPWAPISLAWPLWVWLLIGLLLAALTVALASIVSRRLRRRRFLALLEKNAVPLNPLHQFSKDLRRIGREASGRAYFAELDKSFRWFLARELSVAAVAPEPTVAPRPGAVTREIRKRDKALDPDLARDIGLALRELEQALTTKKSASDESLRQDAQQLTELCRATADRLARARDKSREVRR